MDRGLNGDSTVDSSDAEVFDAEDGGSYDEVWRMRVVVPVDFAMNSGSCEALEVLYYTRMESVVAWVRMERFLLQ